MGKDDQKPWEVVRSEEGPDLKLFRVRFDWVRNPRNGRESKVVVLKASDWVNVVALTPGDKIVAVRQYRFGTGKVTTEIPAGIVEEGETSLDAAKRELREETGFTSETWEYLGYAEPNPAFLSNVCHFWLARDAKPTHAPQLDAGESVSTFELTLDEIRREMKEGRLRHSLAIAALSHVFDLRPSE